MHGRGELRYTILADIETLDSPEGAIPLFWRGFGNDKTTPVAREHTFSQTRYQAMLFHSPWAADYIRKHWLNTSRGEASAYVATVRLDSA